MSMLTKSTFCTSILCTFTQAVSRASVLFCWRGLRGEEEEEEEEEEYEDEKEED